MYMKLAGMEARKRDHQAVEAVRVTSAIASIMSAIASPAARRGAHMKYLEPKSFVCVERYEANNAVGIRVPWRMMIAISRK